MTHKTIPYGFCHCGCGEKTDLETKSVASRHICKGQPRKYVKGHFYGRKVVKGQVFCSGCKELHPVECFAPNPHYSSGYQTTCRAYRRASYHPSEKQLKYRVSQYDMTVDEVQSLLTAQDNCCAICGQHEQRARSGATAYRLCIDHDHLTGRIRGLLCAKCNTALGMFKDDIQVIESALRYLKGLSRLVDP